MAKNFLRRRVWWLPNDQAWVDLQDKNVPGGKYLFYWKSEPDPERGKGARVYKIYLETELLDTFKRSVDVKTYLLRMAYNIKPGFLVPSELLYDAGISYLKLGVWIDDFTTVATGSQIREEVIASLHDVEPPEGRRLRLASISAATEKVRPSKASEIVIPRWQEPRSTKTYSALDDDGWGSYTGSIYNYRPRNVPERPEDGSNLSPVPLDWEDQSWEGRSYRPNATEVEIADEECLFFFSPAKKTLSA